MTYDIYDMLVFVSLCVIHHCSTHYSPTGVPLPRFELAKRHGVVEKAVEQARQQGFQEASNAVPW